MLSPYLWPGMVWYRPKPWLVHLGELLISMLCSVGKSSVKTIQHCVFCMKMCHDKLLKIQFFKRSGFMTELDKHTNCSWTVKLWRDNGNLVKPVIIMMVFFGAAVVILPRWSFYNYLDTINSIFIYIIYASHERMNTVLTPKVQQRACVGYIPGF